MICSAVSVTLCCVIFWGQLPNYTYFSPHLVTQMFCMIAFSPWSGRELGASYLSPKELGINAGSGHKSRTHRMVLIQTNSLSSLGTHPVNINKATEFQPGSLYYHESVIQMRTEENSGALSRVGFFSPFLPLFLQTPVNIFIIECYK